MQKPKIRQFMPKLAFSLGSKETKNATDPQYHHSNSCLSWRFPLAAKRQKMLQIHNTITRQKEDFVPITPGKIGMYVCGVTVYDLCHIGHARTFVNFDMIVRYLRYCGYDVKYVRNITDIDDKIIKRAR